MADPKVTTRLEFIIEEQSVISQVRALGNVIGRELGAAITKASGDSNFLKGIKDQAQELKKISSDVVDTAKIRQQAQAATVSVKQYTDALRAAQVAQHKAFAGDDRATEAEKAARAIRDAAQAEVELARAASLGAKSTEEAASAQRNLLLSTEKLARAEADLAQAEARSATTRQQVAAAGERVAGQELRLAEAQGEAAHALEAHRAAIELHNRALAENIETAGRSAATYAEMKQAASAAAAGAKEIAAEMSAAAAAQRQAETEAERTAAAYERLGRVLRTAEIAQGKAGARVSRAESYEVEAREALAAQRAELELAEALQRGAKSAQEAAEARLLAARASQLLVASEADVLKASLSTAQARVQEAGASERAARVKADIAQLSGQEAAAQADLTAAIERTNASQVELAATSERVGAALGGMRQRTASAAAETKSASDGLRLMGNAAKSVIGHVQAVAAGFLAYAGITSVVDALVTVIRNASAAGREFETAFAGIGKTTDGVIDSFGRVTSLGEAIRAEFQGLAREIPLSIKELLGLGELGGQFDVQARDLPAFAETVGRLVSSTNLQSETAAKSLAQLQNVLGLTSHELEQFASALVYVGNNSATTEDEIVSLSRRLVGTAATFNISASALLGVAAAMKSVGIETEAGSTQVQKFFGTVATAVATGNDNLQKFADVLGLTTAELVTLFEQDSAEVFVRFVESLGAAGRDAIQILADVGLGNERAVRTFLPLANANDLLRTSVEGATQAYRQNTDLLRESEIRYETAAAKLELLKNSWNELLVALSNAPTAGDFFGNLSELLQLAVDEIDVGRLKDNLASTLDEIYGGNQFAAVRTVGGGDIFEALGFDSVPLREELDRYRAAQALMASGMNLTTEEVLSQAVSLAQLHDGYAEIEAAVNKTALAQSLFASGLVETEDLAQRLAAAITEGTISADQLPPALQRVVDIVSQGRAVTDEFSAAFEGASGSVQVLEAASSSLTDAELQLLGITQEVAIATAELTDEQIAQEAAMAALAPAYAEAAVEILKAKDASLEWVASLVDAAAEAGASAAQIEELLRATGALSEEELQAAAAAAQFAAEQERLMNLVASGAISYGQMVSELAAYRIELGLAAEAAAAFGAAQAGIAGSSFADGLAGSIGGGGGGGGGGSRDKIPSILDAINNMRKDGKAAAKDLEKAFKDAGKEIDETARASIEAAESLGSLDSELLKAAESAGATNREILDLAVALGEISPGDAQKALSELARGEGIKAIAQAYTSGKISADQATEAVGQLNEQIASGANIDLSNYGVQIRNVADAAAAGASSAGGAARQAEDEFRNWRLELLKSAEAAGQPLETLVKLARATGEFGEEALLSQARIAAMKGAVDVFGKSLSDVPLEEAEALFSRFQTAVLGIQDADTIAVAFDIITSGEGGIDTLEEQVQFFQSVSAGIEIPIAMRLATTGDALELTNIANELSQAEGIDINQAATIILDIVDVVPPSVDPRDVIDEALGISSDTGISVETAVRLLLQVDDAEARQIAEQYSEDEIVAAFPTEAEVEIGITLRTKLKQPAQDADALERAILGQKQFGGKAAELDVGVSGDTTELKASIEDETTDHDPRDVLVDGDTELLVESILEATEEADPYEVPVEADTADMVTSIQSVLDSAQFKVKVDVDVDVSEIGAAADAASGAASGRGGGSNGGSSSGGGSGGTPKFAEGGMVYGPSHADGGVLAELEGGEYVVPKDRITPPVRELLEDIRSGVSYSPGLTGDRIELQPQSSGNKSSSRSVGASVTSPGLTGGNVTLQPATTGAAYVPDVSSLVSALTAPSFAPVPPSGGNNTAITNNYDMSSHTTYVTIRTGERGSVQPIREIGAYTR